MGFALILRILKHSLIDLHFLYKNHVTRSLHYLTRRMIIFHTSKG